MVFCLFSLAKKNHPNNWDVGSSPEPQSWLEKDASPTCPSKISSGMPWSNWISQSKVGLQSFQSVKNHIVPMKMDISYGFV